MSGREVVRRDCVGSCWPYQPLSPATMPPLDALPHTCIVVNLGPLLQVTTTTTTTTTVLTGWLAGWPPCRLERWRWQRSNDVGMIRFTCPCVVETQSWLRQYYILKSAHRAGHHIAPVISEVNLCTLPLKWWPVGSATRTSTYTHASG